MVCHKVGTFRLLCSGIICVLIGLPLGGFGALQSYMLQRHIYENRCTVSFLDVPGVGSYDGIVCAESRAAYANLYTGSCMGYALAMFPAYFALKYVGFLFSSICCALLVAAGSVVMTEPSQSPWGHDRYSLGLSLIAAAAPFALLNNVNAIGSTTTSPNRVLVCAVLVIAGMQLSPLLWPVLGRYIDPNTPTDDIFQTYLWIPFFALVMVLLLMPFPDIIPRFSHLTELLNATKKGFIPPATDAVSEDELVPLLRQQQQDEEPPSTGFWENIPVKLFATMLLTYLIHSLPMDLMLVSGQIRAQENLDITYSLSIVSPILTAGIVPLLLALSRTITLKTLYLLSVALCTLNFALQLLDIPWSWRIAASSVGICRLILLWFLISSSLRCLGVQAYFLLAIVFLIGGLVQWAFLPLLDNLFVFSVPLFGHNAYLYGLVSQFLVALWTVRFLRDKANLVLRYALDVEARLAFE